MEGRRDSVQSEDARTVQYLVKWRGFTDPTWEPEENHTEVEAVDIYHGRYPEQLAPVRAALVGTRV